MIKERPIGIFDSGLGGLTCAKRLMEMLPGEDIVFLGDTARNPYGTKTKETIACYTNDNVAFLQRRNVKMIIAACGTVSSNVPIGKIQNLQVPYVDVITPTVQKAVAATKNKRIGIIGTAATIKSGSFNNRIKAIDKNIETVSNGCQQLVSLVEAGYIDEGNFITNSVCKEYLKPIKESGCDTLILGCTHYPVIAGIIGDLMGPSVTLIDSGRAAADHARRILEEKELLAGRDGKGSSSFFVSDDPAQFAQNAALFLGGQFRGRVEKVDITAYPDTI